MTIYDYINGIRPADEEAKELARKRNDGLLKPLGSLGKLEDIAIKFAGITGKVLNSAEKRCLIIMAADNGVVEEGVAGTPKEMTRNHSANIVAGVSGSGVLAKYAGSDLKLVDIGIEGECKSNSVIVRKIANGTANFAKGPAMSRPQAEQGIMIGIETVKLCKDEGYELLGTGEMGIGNTSSTAACCMALTGLDADSAVGKGGGLSDEGLARKKEVIKRALALNKPDASDPIDVIAKVGGFDIAGLVGCFLGAAYYRMPIVIDGAISALSALIACRLQPLCADYIFGSHISREPSYRHMMREIKIEPMIDLGMRLGEGSGCPLAFHIIGSACAMLRNMQSFAEHNMDDTYRIDMREDKR